MPLDEFIRWVALYQIEADERKVRESITRNKQLIRSQKRNPRRPV